VAHSLSAKKRIRQNEKRHAMNRARRTALKTKIRKCREELLRGTPESASETLCDAARALDRAATNGTIHRNAAARKKSRLTRKLNTMRAKAAAS
jgi:small subunit ribosomal protein S20